MVARILAALLLLGVIVTPAFAYRVDIATDGISQRSMVVPTPDLDVHFESRVYCLALAAMFEGGSTDESEEGLRSIVGVVAERARANKRMWGGSDICDVVFYKRAGVCQFSFACLPTARRTPKAGSRWQRVEMVARDELQGRNEVRDRSFRYYMNPALTSDRNACRFRKEFVPLFVAGRHEYFREPTEHEKRMLTATRFPECDRYEAAIARAKALTKKRLALKKGKKKVATKAVRRIYAER